MTTLELIALLRVKLADLADAIEPSSVYLFSDLLCTDALAWAQNTFVAETLCLFDITTQPVLSGVILFNLPSRTVVVKSALSDAALLTLVTQHELDYGYFKLNNTEVESRFSNWRVKTGKPKFLVTDLGSVTVRLVPYPNTDVTITIERYKLPSELAIAPSPVQDPEIPEQFHRGLIVGAAAYLLENSDADTYSPEKALALLAQWGRILDEARIQLQTSLRRQERRLDLPDSVGFMESKSNTIGLTPNVNT